MTQSPTPTATPPEQLDRRILAIGGVVVLGAIMAMLDMTVVNVALEHLITEFHSTLATMQWVATGYTLALATVIPLSGWAADRFGTKRVYLSAVLLFATGSALVGLAWSAGSMILFRVLQGLGGGMLVPLSMTILVSAAGPGRIGRVMAVLGIALQLGPIAGPLLGGWLVDDVSWRAAFFLNVPLGIVTLLVGARVLPDDEPRPAQKLDALGLVLLSPALAALIYGLAQVPAHGAGDPQAFLPAAAGAALLVLFVWHAARTPHALIDLGLFRRRGFAVPAVTMVLVMVAVIGSLLLFPLYFQQVRGASALEAGLLVVPQGVGIMAIIPISGRLVDRGHAARLVLVGLGVDIAAVAVLTGLTASTPYWLLAVVLFVLGIGMGMVGMPNMSIAQKTLRPPEIARGSTSLSIIQQCGAAVGTATLAVILSHEVAARAVGAQAPPPAVLADAYASSFRWALVLLVLALVSTLFLPRTKVGS